MGGVSPPLSKGACAVAALPLSLLNRQGWVLTRPVW
jgi:hypothetical protein